MRLLAAVKNEHQNSFGWGISILSINFEGSPVRLRKTCTLKFYGVRAQGWVTPVKAKSDTYVCIVGVCGVLSRQYDMLRLAVVKMSIKTRAVGGLGISK